MNDYTKNALLRGLVVALAGLAIFFGIICFAASPWWAIPFPFAALGYGVYTFVKKYYKKD